MKKVSRNDPCPCGSGKKYKQCCQPHEEVQAKAQPADTSIPNAIRTALEHHQAGRLHEAEAIYRQILQAVPNHPEALHFLGAIAYHQGENESAIELISKAISISPSRSMYYNLGNALQAQGKQDEAVESYSKALLLKPDYAEAHINLGNVLQAQGKLDRAIEHYRKALSLKQGLAETHYNLGSALQAQGKLDEAIASFHRALKLKPDYVEAYYNLGNVFMDQGKLDAAVESYNKALALKPDYSKAHNNLGNALLWLGRLPEAEASYRHTLEIDPECNEALLGLGRLCMESGQMEKAEDLFLHALEAQPDNLAVRFRLALVKKAKAGDANFTALVDAAHAVRNSGNPLPSEDMIFLHFALGKCYDDSGDYEKAFPHFLKGCKLKRATFDYNPDQTTRQFAGIMHIFDRAMVDRLRGAGDPSRLPIFVLGMPRSGTTLTEQIIASHPDVYGAGELPDLVKIVHRNGFGTAAQIAFPDNLRSLNQATLTAWGTEYIAGLQQRVPEARCITDKMPANFIVLGLIHLMLPNAKIIHVNRNPVDTCLSCFTRLFDKQEFTYDMAELGQYYVDYMRLMEHWREVLPAGAFLDVQYEDIVADQETQTRRLIEYCGLEWNDACLDFHKNKRSVQTASVTQVRQPMYSSSVERWRHYEKHLGPLLGLLDSCVRGI